MNDENLIPPKKGEIRNPKGRGKGVHNRSTILKKWIKAKQSIKNPITGIDEKLTQEDAVILALINQGRKGNINAIKEILDTLYGKNVENVNAIINSPPKELTPEQEQELIDKL